MLAEILLPYLLNLLLGIKQNMYKGDVSNIPMCCLGNAVWYWMYSMMNVQDTVWNTKVTVLELLNCQSKMLLMDKEAVQKLISHCERDVFEYGVGNLYKMGKTCKSECQWCWSLKQRCAILPIQGKKAVAFVLYAIAWRTPCSVPFNTALRSHCNSKVSTLILDKLQAPKDGWKP